MAGKLPRARPKVAHELMISHRIVCRPPPTYLSPPHDRNVARRRKGNQSQMFTREHPGTIPPSSIPRRQANPVLRISPSTSQWHSSALVGSLGRCQRNPKSMSLNPITGPLQLPLWPAKHHRLERWTVSLAYVVNESVLGLSWPERGIVIPGE
jgi:hypothetical protein